MKFLVTFLFLSISIMDVLCQPSTFSWFSDDEEERFNYISPAKDQGEQGPCRIFTAVAAVEAMCHIYYNKPFPSGTNGTDLSEREIYSWCSGYGGPLGSASIEEALHYIDTSGIINESCFPYPTSWPFFTNCSTMCSNPDLEVNIPGFEQLNLITVQALKRAIIDYGPIATFLANSGYELHGSSNDENHAVLIIGWNGSGWHIKDSWPSDKEIATTNLNIFSSEYSVKFYRVKYDDNGNTITCSGSECSSVFSERNYTDNDEDGFYNWGIGPKPPGCSGPCKMDFNDADNSTICLDDNYDLLPVPTISGSDLICSNGSSGERTFTINNLPDGFSSSWSVSDPTFFNSPVSDTGSVAILSPKSQYSGDDCIITFTITDGCGYAHYTKHFSINGPADSDLNINVVPSYAPNPIRVSGIWLLCPNSSYYIYCNNTSDCSLSNYQWSYPSGWTKYEQTSNYIRINTNSTPFGTVNVTATTCCGTSHQVITQNFSQGGACSYYSAYPNPVTTELTIEFNEEFDMTTVDATTSLEIFDSGFSKKYNTEKMEKIVKINTSSWKEGFYYIILNHKGQYYSQKIKVE